MAIRISKTLRLLARSSKLLKAAIEQMPKDYTIGAVVRWPHGTYERSGRVEDYTTWGSPDLFVRTPTGKRIRIDVRRLVE